MSVSAATTPADEHEAPNVTDVFGRGDQTELALALLARLEGNGPELVFDEGALYRYAPARGLWRTVERAEQSIIVQSFAGSPLTEGGRLRVDASDVNGAIKLASDRASSRDYFADVPKGLAFADGFLEVTEKGAILVPHDPKHRARFGYNFKHTTAAPLALLRFLHSLHRDDADREERIMCEQEFFGSALLGLAPRWQKCLVLVGEGENGKTRFGEIVSAAMPAGSTCAIVPQQFGQEYRRAQLAGRLLNFVSELPEAAILDAESFKGIIDGSQIEGRHIREAPFYFNPKAAHYFAANRLPGSNDPTHAFWRRFIVIRLTRQFKEGDPDRDPNIHTKIIRDELPAIVSWLVEGAVRMLRNGTYTMPPSHFDELRQWKHNADQVACFLADELEVTKPSALPGVASLDWMPGARVYTLYTAWAERMGHRPPLAANKFGARLVSLEVPKHTNKTGAFYALQPRMP